MADDQGRTPGDDGYDASSDQAATDNGDGTYTDNQGNVMDQGGGLISAGGGGDVGGGGGSNAPPITQDSPQTQGSDQFQTITGPSQQFLNAVRNNPSGQTQQFLDQYGIAEGRGTPNMAGAQPQQQGQKQQDFSSWFKGLDNQLTALMRALSATNEQDFQERVREFNVNHDQTLQEFGLKQEAQKFTEGVTAGALTGMYNGQQTLAGQKQQSELSGMFNGAPTEAARQFNVGEGERERQFNIDTEKNLADLSSRLTGPADYFKFLNATNAGRNIIGSLQSGQARPQFGQMTGNAQPQTLDTIFGRLGIGGQGGSAFSAQPTGGNSGLQPAGTQTPQGMISLPNNMGFIPQPHMINPAVWDSWGKTGQEFVKGAASAAGLDPTWYESTINSTRPGTGTYGAATTGAYSSGGESSF